MRKLLLLISLILPISAFAQLPAVKDTTLISPSTSYTPQTRWSLFGGKVIKQEFINGKWYTLPTLQYINTYFPTNAALKLAKDSLVNLYTAQTIHGTKTFTDTVRAKLLSAETQIGAPLVFGNSFNAINYGFVNSFASPSGLTLKAATLPNGFYYTQFLQPKNGTVALTTDIKASKDSLVNLYNSQTIGGAKTFTDPITVLGTGGNSYTLNGNTITNPNSGTAINLGTTFGITAPSGLIYSDGTVNRLIFSPTGVITRVADGKNVLFQGDVPSPAKLDSTYSTKTPIIGNIYNGVNLSDFTTNGATAATVSGNIEVTGSTNDYLHSLDLNGTTLLDRWEMSVDIIVPTITSTTGFAIGTRSSNVNSNRYSTMANVDLSNTGTAGRLSFIGNTNFTTWASSATNLTFVAGDTLTVYFSRDLAKFTARVVNKTNPQADVSLTYDFNNNAVFFAAMQNRGKFALFAKSSTAVKVVSVKVSSTAPMGAILATGDSKMQGAKSTVYGNSLPGLIGQNYPVINMGGGSDQTPDLVLQMPEIIRIKPSLVLIGVGRNDPQSGGVIAPVMANYAIITAKLDSAKIPYRILTGWYETTADQRPLAAAIKATYPNNFVDNLTPTSADISSLSTDNVHPTDLGNYITYTAIKRSGALDKISSMRPVISSGDISNALGFTPTPTIDDSYPHNWLVQQKFNAGLTVTTGNGQVSIDPIQNAPLATGGSHIYNTTATGGTAYPFLGNGNLVIQSFGTASKDIVFITGVTPTVRGHIAGGTGIWTLDAYGAGSAQFSAAGVLSSIANTGTGSNVLAVSPAITSPTITNVRPATTYQSSTGTTADSVSFVSSQRHVSKAFVAGGGVNIAQTATTVTISAVDSNPPQVLTANTTLALNTPYSLNSTSQLQLTLPPTVGFATDGRKTINITASNTGGGKILIPNGYVVRGISGPAHTDGTGYITFTQFQQLLLKPDVAANSYTYQVLSGSVTVY